MTKELRETKLPNLVEILGNQPHFKEKNLFSSWISMVQEIHSVIFEVHAECPVCRHIERVKKFELDSEGKIRFNCPSCRQKRLKTEVFLAIKHQGRKPEVVKLLTPEKTLRLTTNFTSKSGIFPRNNALLEANSHFWFGGLSQAKRLVGVKSDTEYPVTQKGLQISKRYSKLPKVLVEQALYAKISK